MKVTFLIAVFIITSLHGFAQDLQVHVYDPPLTYTGNVKTNTQDLWGTDFLVSNTEPLGTTSGVCKANDTFYVAIPDTNIVTGNCLVVLKSSNNGLNWVVAASVSPAVVIPKTRMVKSGLDTIYCMFSFASAIYILKVTGGAQLRLPPAASGYRDFDGWASSTGGLYVFLDSLADNSIIRYASSNGGVTWNQRGLVTTTAANPFIVKSGTGDTATLMYYQTPAAGDTTALAITVARYRESGPGALSSINFLTSLIPAGPSKAQFGAALYGLYGWVVYTSGAPGSRDIMYRTTTTSGASYGAETPLANSPNVDEYAFDIKYYTVGVGGADLVYYYDSTGGPTNSTDKVLYTFATTATQTFGVPIQISEHPCQSNTARGYTPIIAEYYNAGGDLGVVWTGLDVAARRVYFDRYNGTFVGIHGSQNGIPKIYSLSQNYPNPFNPVTQISFAIPKNGLVTIKVYDILGREAAIIANKEFMAGTYKVDFDASSLASGIYFYKLVSDDFTETKKMMLVK